MLLDDNEVEHRLGHIDNLVNRMRGIPQAAQQTINTAKDSMGVFGVSESKPSKKNDKSLAVFEPPSISDLVENLEDKLALAEANSAAIGVLNTSIGLLGRSLSDVGNPRDLSRIASDMSRIVNGFAESKKNQPITNQQVIIYKPMILAEDSFDSMHVNDV